MEDEFQMKSTLIFQAFSKLRNIGYLTHIHTVFDILSILDIIRLNNAFESIGWPVIRQRLHVPPIIHENI